MWNSSFSKIFVNLIFQESSTGGAGSDVGALISSVVSGTLAGTSAGLSGGSSKGSGHSPTPPKPDSYGAYAHYGPVSVQLQKKKNLISIFQFCFFRFKYFCNLVLFFFIWYFLSYLRIFYVNKFLNLHIFLNFLVFKKNRIITTNTFFFLTIKLLFDKKKNFLIRISLRVNKHFLLNENCI